LKEEVWKEELIMKNKTGTCPDLFFDYGLGVCFGKSDELFLFAAFEKLRNIEHEGNDDSEDGWLDDVIVDSGMELGRGKDDANKKIEERPDNKTDDESSNEKEESLFFRVFDLFAHGHIVAWIDGWGSYVVELAKVAALAQW
jgi:hypothetical protein